MISQTEHVSEVDVANKHVSANHGDTVHLRCDPPFASGNSVTWVTGDTSPRVSVRGPVLSVTSAKYSDTQTFTCRNRNTGASSSVHVFVRDPNNLYVNPLYQLKSIVHINSDTPTNIGCQPTDDRAVFRLVNGNNVDITLSLEENQLVWSHQSGLWVTQGQVRVGV